MASKTLPRASIETGSAVLAAIDKLGLQPEGAFWLYDDAACRWQFFIISSMVDIAGPRWLYVRLNRVLPKMVRNLPSHFDLRLGSPKEVLAEEVRLSLARAKSSRRGPAKVDFGEGSRNLVVYRINSAMPNRATHRVRAEFRKKLQEIEEARAA